MICVSEHEMKIIQNILREHAVDCEVRAFGSRYKWIAKDYSDLDLAIVGKSKLSLTRTGALRDAFEESDLPFRVDILDWHGISKEFQAIINKGYEVIYPLKESKIPSWPKVHIADVCSKITSGGTPLTTRQEYYDGSIPWLRTQEINFNRIYKTEKYISDLGLSNSSAKYIPENTVIVAMYGATAGKIAIAKISLTTNQACCNLIIDDKISDYGYIYYYLKNNYEKLSSLANGGAQQNLNAGIVADYPLSLPPLPTQRAVAAILSCLDDKIELNNRINTNLEAQAQAIFKSWFVDFEPFQGGEFVDSALGKIPEGWKVGRLGEIADITMGQSPDGSSYNATGNGTVFYQGRAEFGWRYPMNRLYTTEPKRMAKKGDILMSVRAPVGDINVANEDCCIGRGLAAINSKHTSFILYTMKSLKTRLDMFNGEGTVFGSINKDNLNDMKIIIPIDKSVQDFEIVCNAMDKQVCNNEMESRALASIRDALLPKLMSGEIEVGEEKLCT